MFEEPVVYVDIETTGGSYRTSRIIEIAAIRVENNQITDTFNTLINPGVPIPHHITRLTGIKNTDVEDAPFFEQISERLSEILTGAIFIAHHVRFDYSFIKRQLEICNIAYKPKMLCSVRLSRSLYPGVKGHGLEAIINRFGIKTQARHRAYDDAMAVKAFLQIAFDQFGTEEFQQAVSKQMKHRSMPPNLNSRAFDNIPNTPGVYTFWDKSSHPIYIGKSVTLRRRIMSHFAQDTAIDKEMKLSLNTHKISFIETSSELEALLLESKMIKEQLPLYNQLLRRVKKMYVLRANTNDEGYMTIEIDYLDTNKVKPEASIYGVHTSKLKAKSHLENLQRTYDLCPKLLNLEKATKACFRYQLGKCRGACIKNEPSEEYNSRFSEAFSNHRLEEWPFRSPIMLIPREDKTGKALVVDKWNIIGEIQSHEGCETLYKPWNMVFDMDTYKILRSYIIKKSSVFNLRQISYTELNSIS